MMKLIAVLVLSVSCCALSSAATLSEDQMAKLRENGKKCMDSTGVKPEEVEKIKAGNFNEDPNTKKYFGCMFRAAGIFNEAGQLQIDVLRTKIPSDVKKEDIIKVFAVCKDKKGADMDETAYLLYRCYWETTPNHISFGI